LRKPMRIHKLRLSASGSSSWMRHVVAAQQL
jgi:hypothetical protein